MYRSLCHHGSLTEYVYVSLFQPPTPELSPIQLGLGQRICPKFRRRHQCSLCLVGGSTTPTVPWTSCPSRSRKGLVQRTRPRCSCRRTKYKWILFLVDRPSALHTRMRPTMPTRLDTRRFRRSARSD